MCPFLKFERRYPSFISCLLSLVCGLLIIWAFLTFRITFRRMHVVEQHSEQRLFCRFCLYFLISLCLVCLVTFAVNSLRRSLFSLLFHSLIRLFYFFLRPNDSPSFSFFACGIFEILITPWTKPEGGRVVAELCVDDIWIFLVNYRLENENDRCDCMSCVRCTLTVSFIPFDRLPCVLFCLSVLCSRCSMQHNLVHLVLTPLSSFLPYRDSNIFPFSIITVWRLEVCDCLCIIFIFLPAD